MKLAPVLLILPLLASCGSGLSEEEKRAAKAHADNVCLAASLPEDAAYGGKAFAQQVAGLSDMAAVSGAANDKETRFVVEGTRLARERGCIK